MDKFTTDSTKFLTLIGGSSEYDHILTEQKMNTIGFAKHFSVHRYRDMEVENSRTESLVARLIYDALGT